MDDPLPFPPSPDELIAGSCSECGLLTDLEALNEHLSSMIPSSVSAVVDRFLSNNHPLPSETRAEIASSLEPNAALLEKMDEAVARLSDILASLKATRDTLATQVNRSRSVLHPLRILPDECLSSIFSQCITNIEGQDDNLLRGLPPQFLENDPWALTRISRHWKDVALNTPKIWSNIVLFFTGDQPRWQLSDLSDLNFFLTRSATHPLNVVIISPYNVSMKHPLLQGVMAHCQRWRRLYLNIRFATFTFLNQIYHNLPVLDHLFIEFSGIDDYNTTLPQITERIVPEWVNFSLATNLRSICVYPRIIQDTFGYCPQFANQIKKYRSVFCDPSVLPAPPFPFTPCIHLRALRKLPNVEDWTAMCLFEDGWPSAKDDVEFEEEGGMVVMNELRSIRIKEKEDYWGAIAQVLGHMSVPQLSKLTLEGNLDERCISSVIDFIDRSDSIQRIQTLTLIDTGRNTGAAPLIPLLSELRSLTELSLQYTSLPPPSPPPAQINLMDDEMDLLSLAEHVLPKGLEILVLSDKTRLDESILDGVRESMPGLKFQKVDKLEVI
jgi:hypothetical protein